MCENPENPELAESKCQISDMASEISHLDGSHRSLVAFIAESSATAVDSLLEVVGGDDAVDENLTCNE